MKDEGILSWNTIYNKNWIYLKKDKIYMYWQIKTNENKNIRLYLKQLLIINNNN